MHSRADAAATPPRIVDPRAVPLVGIDDHLPPLPPARLTPAAVRARFVRAAAWQVEHAGDGATFFPDRAPMPAAVLVPLVVRGETLTVLLTRRTDHLRDHAGQVSFPGGRCESGDCDAAGTALREAAEEIGLARDRVEVVGELPPYTTVTRFVVTPVIGLVHSPFELAPDGSEVAEVFEVPLEFLMNPAHHRRHRFVHDDIERQFLAMPWRHGEREYFVWGATAAMLRNLYRFLAAP